MEGPMYRLEPTPREVCCLPRAWIRSITGKLSSKVLWLLSVGHSSWQHWSNKVQGQSRDTSGPWENWWRYREHGLWFPRYFQYQQIIGIGRSTGSVCGYKVGVSKNILFPDHRIFYSTPGLVTPDQICPSHNVKRVLAQE